MWINRLKCRKCNYSFKLPLVTAREFNKKKQYLGIYCPRCSARVR